MERLETDSLCHYQPFKIEEHHLWLKDLLTKCRVHCSNPMAFNDPWDGKPHFNLTELEDPKRREEIALYFEKVFELPLPNNEIGRIRRVELRSPRFLKRLLDIAESDLSVAISEQYRVFCVSPFLI